MSLTAKRPSKGKAGNVATLDQLKAQMAGQEEEKKKRLNAEVPESWHTEALIFAKRRSMTLTELTITAINEYMSKHSNE